MGIQLKVGRGLCALLTFAYLTLGRPSFWKSARLSFGILRKDRRMSRRRVSNAGLQASGFDLVVVESKMPLHNSEAGSTRILRLVDEASSYGCRVGVIGLRGPVLGIVEPGSASTPGFGSPVSDDVAWQVMRDATTLWLSRPDAAGRVVTAVGFRDTQAVIYDTVDLHWRRYDWEAAATGSQRLRVLAVVSRLLERLLAALSDHVVVVSHQEAMLLSRGVARRVKPAVISTIHDVGEPAKPDGRSGLVFVGAYGHKPNTDAVEWMIDEIVPALAENEPNLQVLIVGDGLPDGLIRKLPPSMSYLGFVEDLDCLLGSCRGLLAPLRYGAGVKGKVGAALAAGLPVVTTSVGAEGLDLTHGVSALIADEPAEIVANALRLLRDDDLWQKLSSGGQNALSGSAQAPQVRESLLRTLIKWPAT